MTSHKLNQGGRQTNYNNYKLGMVALIQLALLFFAYPIPHYEAYNVHDGLLYLDTDQKKFDSHFILVSF